MVWAGPPAYAPLLAAAERSSCQETACGELPSPFIRTAEEPLALGPTQSWPEKLVSDAEGGSSASGSAASSVASAAAVCTVAARGFGLAKRVSPLSESMPTKLGEEGSVPAEVGWNVHRKSTDEPGGTVCAAGAAKVAAAVPVSFTLGVTLFASPPPVLVTVTARTMSCPTLAVVRSSDPLA